MKVKRALCSQLPVFATTIALILIGVSPAQAAAPNAPTNVTIANASPAATALDAAAITVSFTPSVADASHSAPTNYVLTATSTGHTTRTTTIVCSSGTTTCTGAKVEGIIEQLDGGATYDVVVSAKYQALETAATSVPFQAQSIPQAPTVSSAVGGVKKVTLTWSAPTNTGGLKITGYTITATGISTSAGETATSKVIEGLSDATTYSFKIIATNGNGNSASADFADATTNSVPGAPQSVSASVSSTTISTSWSAPTSNGGSSITEYKVYLIDNSGADVTAQTKTTVNTSIDITSVSPGTYSVKVTAKNAVGEGARSTASTSVTVAGTPTLLPNDPVISPSSFGDVYVDDAISVSATASFGTTTFTVSANPAGACTISSGVIRAVSAGTCTLTATTPGDSTYATGSSTKNFTISKVAQSITFPAISAKTQDASVVLDATASSGLSIAYSRSGPCSISGTTLTFSALGACVVTASQAGNSKYASATLSRTIEIITAGGGGGFAGGGGGFAPPAFLEETKTLETFLAAFKVLDEADPMKVFPGEVCVEMYLAGPKGEELSAGTCNKSGGTLDVKVPEGSYRILFYAAGLTNSSKQVSGEMVKGKLSIKGLPLISGSSRYEVKLAKPSATPKPTPTPVSATPKPSASPTPNSTPSQSPTSSSTPLLKNSFLQSVSPTKSTKTLTLTTKSSAFSVKVGATVNLAIPLIPRGAQVTFKVKTPDGKTVALPTTSQTKVGRYVAPTLKLSKPGAYTLSVVFGKTIRQLALKVTK